jgi:hypothetical protein
MFENNDSPEFDVFTDLLFNSLVAFAFLFFVAFALIHPEAETGRIDTDVQILITVDWPDGNPDDIDTYVEGPAGNIVWYNQPEADLMHLDRDDRGMFRDVILMNGREIENPLNQEIVSVRGLLDGEYVVNVMRFLANTTDPVTVSVRVQKMNPTVSVIYYGNAVLKAQGDEHTMVRFTMDGNEVRDVNDRPKSLIALTQKLRAGQEAPTGPLEVGLSRGGEK